MVSVSEELKKGITQWAIRGLSYKAFVALVLMLSAGRAQIAVFS